MRRRIIFSSSVLGSYAIQKKGLFFWSTTHRCGDMAQAVRLVGYLEEQPEEGAVLYEV